MNQGSKNWYSCSAEEWVFCKFFSFLYQVDRGLKVSIRTVDKASLKKGLLILVFMIAAGYAGYFAFSSFAPWHNVFALLPILAFPVLWLRIFYFDQMKHNRAIDEASREAPPGSEVPYLQVSREGISINLLGNTDPRVVPFIAWEPLKKIELHYTTHPFRIGAPENKFMFRERMAQYFEQMQKKYPRFDAEPRDEYDDQFSLLLTHRPGFLTQVTIPASWICSGKLKLLIRQIEAFSGREVKPYPYLGEQGERMRFDYAKLMGR